MDDSFQLKGGGEAQVITDYGFGQIQPVKRASARVNIASWLAANPDDPKHDPFAAAVVQQQIAAGKFEEAARWTQMIGDVTLRGQVTEAIRAKRMKAVERQSEPR